MASPECAACGLAIRKGERIKAIWCYVVHQRCAHMPQSRWVQSGAQASLDADVLRLKLQAADAEKAALRKEVAERERGGSYLTLMAKCERLEAKVVTLEREKQGLELRLVQTSRAQAEAEASVVRARRAQAWSADLEKVAVGLLWGRGLWGFFRYYAKLVLDTKDDAEARFSLLEL